MQGSDMIHKYLTNRQGFLKTSKEKGETSFLSWVLLPAVEVWLAEPTCKSLTADLCISLVLST